MHEHHAVALPGLLLLAGLCGYTGLMCLPRRRRAWQWWRTASWFAGLAAAGFAVLDPPVGGGFAGHSLGHLLLGMLAPLLVCTAAPVMLLLRGLPVRAARRVSGLLRSAPVVVLTHPVTVVVLDAGSLWPLYATPLYQLMSADSPLRRPPSESRGPVSAGPLDPSPFHPSPSGRRDGTLSADRHRKHLRRNCPVAAWLVNSCGCVFGWPARVGVAHDPHVVEEQGPGRCGEGDARHRQGGDAPQHGRTRFRAVNPLSDAAAGIADGRQRRAAAGGQSVAGP
jgi:hypothetical protein